MKRFDFQSVFFFYNAFFQQVGTALHSHRMTLRECLAPLRTLLVADLRAFDTARRQLNDMRRDLDAAKNTPKVDTMLVAKLEVAFNQQQDNVCCRIAFLDTILNFV